MMQTMAAYLTESDILDFSHPEVKALAERLSAGCTTDVEIARKCFLYVRDEIAHSGDTQAPVTTCTASEVLQHRTGWCYAKSHLLAALLRANGIPAGLAYQRLSCSEYRPDIYCLHGLNTVYLYDYGWYRIDPRGNKEGVDARFDPPREHLAFVPVGNEYDLEGNFTEPLDVVIEALRNNPDYESMIEHFPDLPRG